MSGNLHRVTGNNPGISDGRGWETTPPFDDMVFTTQQGVPVRHGDVNRTIKSVVLKVNLQEEELAGFEKRELFVLKSFSPYCFRHTFVILLRNAVIKRNRQKNLSRLYAEKVVYCIY